MSKLLMENWLKNSQQIIKNSDSSEQEVAISPVPVGNKNLYSNNTTSQERISLENISESHSEIEISTDDDQHDETSPDETSLNPLTVKNVKKSLQRGKYAASGWKTDLLFKDWLESGNSENSMMRCKICHCSLMSKMSVLRLHMHSKKHKNAAASLNLNQHIKFESKRINKQVKINEVRSALYISCHTSINSVNHFISVQKMNSGKNGSVQNMALNRTKCTAVIKNIIGPYFIKSIKNDIDDSMYSIIIDESTDISVKKYLGIVLKYYSKSQSDIVTLFVKLEQLDDCKASGIVNAIKKCLREFELPLEKLCGIGTDNASVMVGVNNGVYKKLKDEIPNLILIPCVCHSLQLAVSAAGSSCLPEYIEFLIAETYNWFSNSSSRQGDYSKLFGLINDGHDPKKIVRSCQTRWMSIYSAIKRISDQWLELKTHFSLIGNSEKCYKSSLLNKIYSDNKNLAYILFLKYILKEVTKVNLLFESNSADVTKIFNDLIFLIKFVVYILIPMDTPNFDPMHSPLNKEIWLKFPYLGHETEEILKKIEIEDQQVVRNECTNFLLELVMQLRQRLPTNIKILKKINCFNIENMKANNLKKIEIQELLQEFNDPDKTTKVMNQLNNCFLIDWKNEENTIKFWDEVYKYKDAMGDSPFQDLAEFAFKFLCLPFSNAEVERAFSKMNILKTKLRNRMGLPLLNSLLNIKTWLKQIKKCCHDYEIQDEILEKIGTKEAYRDDNISQQDDYVLDLLNLY